MSDFDSDTYFPEYADDAWRKSDVVFRENTKEWKVRADLRVEALGTERSVRLTMIKERPGARSSLEPKQHHFTERNLLTMRELAQALLDACDYVESVNPCWAQKAEELS